MSCERKVITFTEIEEVRIECCNKEELISLENNIITAIEQKLEKLNILIKNCDVYAYNDSILVNDRFNICMDLPKIAEAFGLSIKQIQCSMKGKNYIITDELIKVLKQFERDFKLGANVQNKPLSEVIKQIISSNESGYRINDSILTMVRNIKENGQYVTTRIRVVSEKYEDQYLKDRSEGEWVSNAEEIRNELLKISKSAQNTIKNANAQLRDGTAKLIYARARQMGYSVQEVKKGTQTQLVLVRCE